MQIDGREIGNGGESIPDEYQIKATPIKPEEPEELAEWFRYEEIQERVVPDGTLQYGVIRGGTKVFLIKAGLGGSIYGYENKYLRMAIRLNRMYGYTVVVADNPLDVPDPLADAMSFVFALSGAEDGDVLFMGVSNGAVIGAQFGWQYPRIKRMLLINGPLMINWVKTKEGLRKFAGEKAVLIYGDRDPSGQYAGIINEVRNPAVTYEIVPGADHNFAGMSDVFDALPEKII